MSDRAAVMGAPQFDTGAKAMKQQVPEHVVPVHGLVAQQTPVIVNPVDGVTAPDLVADRAARGPGKDPEWL